MGFPSFIVDKSIVLRWPLLSMGFPHLIAATIPHFREKKSNWCWFFHRETHSVARKRKKRGVPIGGNVCFQRGFTAVKSVFLSVAGVKIGASREQESEVRNQGSDRFFVV